MNDMIYESYLEHHGILGQKWGVRRYQNLDGSLTSSGRMRLATAQKKAYQNTKLEKKALNAEKKANKLYYKGEQVHAKRDIGSQAGYARRTKKYAKKSIKYAKKASKTTDPYKQAKLNMKSDKAAYKSAKSKRDAEQIALTTPYGSKALSLRTKSEKVKAKAARYRVKMSKNTRYIQATKITTGELPSGVVKRGNYYVTNMKRKDYRSNRSVSKTSVREAKESEKRVAAANKRKLAAAKQ